MKKKFTEAQIVFALRQAEGGTPVAEIIRKMEISEVTFYRWKKKYAGLGVSELRRTVHMIYSAKLSLLSVSGTIPVRRRTRARSPGNPPGRL